MSSIAQAFYLSPPLGDVGNQSPRLAPHSRGISEMSKVTVDSLGNIGPTASFSLLQVLELSFRVQSRKEEKEREVTEK